MEAQSTETKPEFWAVVEVMGHSVYAGKVTDVALGGTSFIRVDVPEIPERSEAKKQRVWSNEKQAYEYLPYTYETPGAPAYTKYLGASAIFAITPCTEAVAREVADQKRQQPVSVIDMPSPKALLADPANNDNQGDGFPYPL
jgi:hypothetical protein